MNKISNLIESKFSNIKYVDHTQLPNSGTDYVYPAFCNEVVTKFYDGRRGFLIQLTAIDTLSLKHSRSCFVVHQRWSDSNNTVVYSGPNELYNDCIIRDIDNFVMKLEKLFNGEIVDGIFNDLEPDEFNKGRNDHIQFKLGTANTKDMDTFQRPMLMVIN